MAQILSAYQTVMNPMTAPQARAQATQFLETVKQDVGMCRSGALELMQQANPQTRHLAAILLENIAKLHWQQLNNSQVREK